MTSRVLLLLSLGALCAVCVECASPAAGLYGIDGPSTTLVHIDPATSKQTKIGSTLPNLIVAEGHATLDESKAVMYALGFNATTKMTQVVGLSLADGKVVSLNNLPLASEFLVGAGETVGFRPSSGEVLVSGPEPSDPKTHTILALNPSTGKTRKLGSIGDVDVLGGISVYDAKADIYWIEYGVKTATGITTPLFGFDASGKTSGKPKEVQNTAILESATYDATRSATFGVGLRINVNKTAIRTAVKFSDEKFQVLGDISDFFIMQSGSGAFDSKQGIIYSIMQEKGNPKNPFQLVGYNIASNKVTSVDMQCAGSSPCIWSMQYYNGGSSNLKASLQ